MKNKFLLKLPFLFFIFFAVQTESQSIGDLPEMDQNFLDSLPESVQEDLMSEMKQDKGNNKNLQSRPSSELSKYKTLDDWEKFKKQQSLDKQSERYGLRLFNTMQSSFMPLNEPNFGSNYIVDYGDSIAVNTFGSKKLSYIADVKRDGTILLEEIGSITVAGLNFEQVINLINNKYKVAFIGINVAVNLDSIRDINILITGNVAFPGIYTLSGNSNILQALNIAGGINENGSLRNISLKRSNKIDQKVEAKEKEIMTI